MSEWINIKDDDIEIDNDLKEIYFYVSQNNSGNIWACLSFEQIQNICKKI